MTGLEIGAPYEVRLGDKLLWPPPHIMLSPRIRRGESIADYYGDRLIGRTKNPDRCVGYSVGLVGWLSPRWVRVPECSTFSFLTDNQDDTIEWWFESVRWYRTSGRASGEALEILNHLRPNWEPPLPSVVGFAERVDGPPAHPKFAEHWDGEKTIGGWFKR